jgi:hypothetical protein
MALNVEVKISGTGWLCVKNQRGNWIPVFQVTEEQLREWNDTFRLYTCIEEKAEQSVKPRKVQKAAKHK